MKRFSLFAALLLVVGALSAILLGGGPAFASDRPASGGQEKISPAPPAKAAASAAPQSGIAVPAEMQELLADNELLREEIERILAAEGPAVKIPVSVKTLQARRDVKIARYTAWLDAQKIPWDWNRKGWKLDKWVFLPPPAAPAAPAVPQSGIPSPSKEQKKSAEPPKPEEKKP